MKLSRTPHFRGKTAPLLGLAALTALGLAATPQAARAQAAKTFGFTTTGFKDENNGFSPTSTLVTGSFTGTPEADGLIEFGNGSGRDDLTAFSATISGSPIVPNTTFTLTDILTGDHTSFKYGAENGQTVLMFYVYNGDSYLNPLTAVNGGNLGEQQTTLGPPSGAETEISTTDPIVIQTGTTPAPEPSSMAAFIFAGLGLAGLILKARKRKSAA